MREIKFRAWDLNEDEYISWDHLIRTRYNQDYYKLNNKGDTILSMMTDEHIILEQYTGLHDKNGREIYEGDIVKKYPGQGCEWEERICTITFRPASFMEQYEGWATNLDDYDSTPEVIGNIHETPDLLDH